MSYKLSKFIQLGIVGIWLCLAFTLVYRHYVSGEEVSALQSISENKFKTSEEWFGAYFQNEKVGYIKTSSEKIGDEFRFTRYTETDIPKDGEVIRVATELSGLTDLEYRMKSFTFESRSGGDYYKTSGELDSDNMLLVFKEAKGQKQTEAVEMKARPYLPVTVKPLLVLQGLEKGKRFSIPVLDILSLRVTDIIVEVVDLVPVKAGVNVGTAYLLKIGQNSSWMSGTGKTFKEKLSSGHVYYLQAEDAAKSEKSSHIFDFLSIPVLKSNKLLPEPESLSQLKVRLSGFDFSEYPMLNEGNQVFSGGILEIRKEDAGPLKELTYDLPYGEKGLEPFLEPTPFVQSDHHTVLYNAKKNVALEKHAFRLARYLTSNLYLTIQKMPSSRLNTSMDIFATHEGESNEHTVMFASFARAAGMPTRMVGGLVYLKGHFYYHAWPEVWFGRWVPVDPTMGQFPADVTHIRFVEGDIDRIASFGAQIKNIKVEIMETL